MEKLILNDKFRIKLTDRCSLACPFCHAEGGKYAKDIALDQEFLTALELLRPLFRRVHLTGGEPMLYQDLDRLLDILQDFGYRAAITTNGLFSLEERLQTIKRLDYVNFSVHSLREAYVKDFIHKGQLAKDVIATITRNVETLSQIMPVRINTVVSEKGSLQGLEELLKFAGERHIEVKLVPEWRVRDIAEQNIRELLKSNGFNLCEKIYLFPGSNVRERYQNQFGQIVEVKSIEFFFPEFLCQNCKKKDFCQEGFSFLRLGGNPLYFQPCIFGEKVNLQEFEESMLPPIRDMFKEAVECGGFAAKQVLRANGSKSS